MADASNDGLHRQEEDASKSCGHGEDYGIPVGDDLRAVSLFSGIGGLDLAAEWAGFTPVAFVERDEYCRAVLAAHWPGVPQWDDVCEFGKEAIGEAGERITLITAGFP